MLSKAAVTFVVALVLLCGTAADAADVSHVADSVVMLYSQTAHGGMQMRCTATAFETVAGLTKFLTAAHCVSETTKGGQRTTKDPLFVTPDALDDKTFSRASITFVGNQREGFDLAIISARMPKSIPVTPLGDESSEYPGSPVVNVAAPAGIGKVYFTGFVAMPRIDRPLVDEEEGINWMGAMLVQITAAGGSSGSAIVSVTTGKIVAVLVGGYGPLTIAIPVSRVNAIVKEGKKLGRGTV